ncbi:hypothetical protein [Caballeronia sp. SBC2]|uniref:hypothetical protein n=1 Tax=Caballeronia sp. SBC2 TaxID=2705547 RepID=UPI0013E0FDA8|nr:hypothetical protein [Caballeronia sp. SBC2]QIE22602.1 hypothetical protein SBC2_06120 [Caballeronia sp. SBC2]
MRKLCKIALAGVLVAGLSGCQPDKTGETLFVCNSRALDKEAVLQRHTDEVIPVGAQAADFAAVDDACMWSKGYAFKGEDDTKYCSDARIPQCYSSR